MSTYSAWTVDNGHIIVQRSKGNMFVIIVYQTKLCYFDLIFFFRYFERCILFANNVIICSLKSMLFFVCYNYPNSYCNLQLFLGVGVKETMYNFWKKCQLLSPIPNFFQFFNYLIQKKSKNNR